MSSWIPLTEGWARIAGLAVLAIGAHFAVLLVRRLAAWLGTFSAHQRHPKMRSVSSLLVSTFIFTIWFSAIGLVLQELGVSLKAYLASASVVGLAVAFGSQGLVQDVVTGLTVVFSDLLDVGDMVEIGGQTGIVRSIGLRFVVLENPMGAEVFIPNRSITNVINYPKGYVRCIVDVLLLGDEAAKKAVESLASEHLRAVTEQFPAVFIHPPSVEGRQTTSTGKDFLRLKFRIWPNRGGLIEGAFKQELLQVLKRDHADYSDWMISVNYEVERTTKKMVPGTI